MASKRKSSVPCMIPSKSKHMREDIILGCLPELLPTIPEDSILSISSKDEDTQRFHDLSKAEPKTSCWERGTYSCPLCCFESGDLNLFLHHMDNCHMDFHAQPNFYCLSCKVSAVKFEGLALHNAKSHPELHTTHKRVSLQVTKRDGAITVEQTLFTEEDLSESGISITKTPIMKMTKGGHKRIVVSHTVEVQRAEPSSDKPATVTNGTSVRTLPLTTSPHIIGGISASPVHKIPNALGIPGMHNRAPLWNSNPSSPDSNADLPKVMIPLSSIPTYDPAMDLSSFLKTSFGKFPYPTKAELCYLTVVSGFPEEQIKLWFTAQRLKQGISWSPEEIEDTRRKMFNTVFQATPKTSRNQSHHPISQHCVSVQSASLSSNYMKQIPKGSAMGWKGGVIVSQPSVTQATSLKQQPVVHTPQINIHHAVITKETGNELSCRTAENCNVAGRGGSVSNHGHTGKGETGCSSSIKPSASCLPGIPKSQNSSYTEGSIMTLTNIVRKIDCHINDRNANCTSKSNISPTSIYGQQKASSNAKENSNSSFATTSKFNNGSTYKSTSHSTICTKREGNILDHTSKSNTDTSVICSSSSSNNIQTEEFIPPLVPQPGSLMDPSLGKGKVLPEQPVTLKQSFIHNSFPEQKQFLAPQGQPYHVRTLTDSQSAMAGSFSNLPQSSLQSNSCLQEEMSQHSSPSLPAPQEQHSPKTLLGAPQVQSTDFTAVHYKEHDPKHLPALDKDSKQSHFDKERLHRNVTQQENEGRLSEQHSGITNTFYKADKNEHSNLINTLHTFTNDNTNKAKQGMPLLRQYIQEVHQWESNSNYHEELNVSPMKINVIALNKEESLYKTNSKQLISKPLESLINDGGPSHKNESSDWHKSYRHLPVDSEERISDIGNTEPHQPDNLAGLEMEQAKRDLRPERKSIFQSLDSETPTLPLKKKSKEATMDLDKSTTGEQDYWEIKDEERQQPMGNQSLRGHQAQDSQSRDCLRGELLKV